MIRLSMGFQSQEWMPLLVCMHAFMLANRLHFVTSATPSLLVDNDFL